MNIVTINLFATVTLLLLSFFIAGSSVRYEPRPLLRVSTSPRQCLPASRPRPLCPPIFTNNTFLGNFWSTRPCHFNIVDFISLLTSGSLWISLLSLLLNLLLSQAEPIILRGTFISKVSGISICYCCWVFHISEAYVRTSGTWAEKFC